MHGNWLRMLPQGMGLVERLTAANRPNSYGLGHVRVCVLVKKSGTMMTFIVGKFIKDDVGTSGEPAAPLEYVVSRLS